MNPSPQPLSAPPSSPVPPRERRSRRSERWLFIGWLLIAIKCAAIWWLIETYDAPIHPMWLVGPTVLFGLLATALYIWRD